MDRVKGFHYSLTPLTQDDAQNLGHVEWVVDGHLRSALSAMFNALQGDAVNIAIWADARDRMTPGDRDLIAAWRRDFQLAARKLGTGLIRRDRLERDLTQVSVLFDGLQSYPQQRLSKPREFPAVNAMLHARAMETVRAIFETTAAASVCLDVRAGPLDKTRSPHEPHIDGTESGPLRLLDYIEGPAGLFVSNDYVREKRSFLGGTRYEVKSEPFYPFRACPEGSLVLIANHSLKCKPVAHSSPFTPPGAPKSLPRALITYDLYFK